MKKSKTKILFVGSFPKIIKDGRTGGQLFACTSLIESELSEQIDWILIDSSTRLPVPGLFIRSLKALFRLTKTTYHIVFSKIDLLLVFAADGPSIVEKGLICILGKSMGKKVILSPRSGYLQNDLEKPFYRRFIGYLFANVDIVLCQSRSWREQFIGCYPNVNKAKFIVRMNWIDESLYHNPDRTNHEKSDVIRISFIGWVEKTKGIEDLIYAIHELKDERIALVIAGNGDYFSEAKTLVKALNLTEKIELVGWINLEAKLALLARSDIFVLPSHFEGMPNAVLEAMAAGLPVVATNVGGIPDMIVDNQSGILIQPKQKKQLADALKKLIDDPEKRKRLGENARFLVQSRHSIQSAVEDFEAVIHD